MLRTVLTLGLLAASSTAFAGGDGWPDSLALPDGFQPEGIAAGYGNTFYVGSMAGHGIYKGDISTGEGEVIGGEGIFGVDAAIGMDFDARSGQLFVANGPKGGVDVFDGDTGDLVDSVSLSGLPLWNSLTNDCYVSNDGVWASDSFLPAVHHLPLGPAGGLDGSAPVSVWLWGDYVHDPYELNGNGIVATPNGDWLVLGSVATGTLYRVDPSTGHTVAIDLGGGYLPNDGLLLDTHDDGTHTLYVGGNAANTVFVIDLAADLTSGAIVDTIWSPDFDTATTLMEHGDDLYVVNGRFDVAPPPFPGTPPAPEGTEYEVTRVSK